MNKKDLDTLKAFRKEYPIIVDSWQPEAADDEGYTWPKRCPKHEDIAMDAKRYLDDDACLPTDDIDVFELVKEDALALMRIINKVKEARKEKNLDDLEKYSHLLAIGYRNSFLFCDDNDALIKVVKYAKKFSKIAKNLAKGRAAGSKSNTERKEVRHALIRQELDQLYRQGQGYKMTYEEIADFLIERKISTYAKTTTLKHVKKYAPEIKAQYKTV